MIARRVLAAVVVIVAAAATAAAAWFVYGTPGAVIDDRRAEVAPLETGGEPVLIDIAPGASAKDIGGQLAAAGVVRSGRLFEVLVGLAGLQNSLEAGLYEFDHGTPAIEAVHRIAQGRTASRRIVFPEGVRAEEIGEILQNGNIVSKQAFLDAVAEGGYHEPFLSQLPTSRLEGFLFPAVYEFKRNTDAGEVVATLLNGFQINVADGLSLEGQPLTLLELVTLASIVQREAADIDEMPLIAGVFTNRLRLGLPLQADPTVQYALAQGPASIAEYGYWKGELTFDDLRFDSPYNTYVYAGLPPGPIANPGLDALEAVIRPAVTEYLYFVAKNDGTGQHAFAKTLDEHLRNVELYQAPGQ